MYFGPYVIEWPFCNLMNQTLTNARSEFAHLTWMEICYSFSHSCSSIVSKIIQSSTSITWIFLFSSYSNYVIFSFMFIDKTTYIYRDGRATLWNTPCFHLSCTFIKNTYCTNKTQFHSFKIRAFFLNVSRCHLEMSLAFCCF